jgi:hypothetical protein
MVQDLPVPEVIRCYFDEQFDPPLPAMCLHWGLGRPEPLAQLWQLPAGVSLDGPPPQRFGIRIQRLAADAYTVRLLWDRTCFVWTPLDRLELADSSLAPLLSALGTDLDYLLDQPVESCPTTFSRAA